MTAPSASLPTHERSPVLFWAVVALQTFLLFELVVRVQTDLSSSTEGMVGYGVLWAGVCALLILGATIAWVLGRVWPLVVVDLGWAMLSLIREWPIFDDLAFEGYEPLVPTALVAAIGAIAAAWLALTTQRRARPLMLTGFLAFLGLLEFVLGGTPVPLGIGLLLFGLAGLRWSRGNGGAGDRRQNENPVRSDLVV